MLNFTMMKPANMATSPPNATESQTSGALTASADVRGSVKNARSQQKIRNDDAGL